MHMHQLRVVMCVPSLLAITLTACVPTPSVKELKLKLDSAMGELGQLKEARQRQTQMVICE